MSDTSVLKLCPTFSHPRVIAHSSLHGILVHGSIEWRASFSRSQNTDLYAKAKHFMHSFRGHLLSLSYSFPFHDLSEAHKHMGQCLSFRIF